MMPDYEKAVKDLRRFKEAFSGVFALAEFLEDVPSIERAGNEARARLDILRQQEAEVSERLAAAEAEANQVLADAKLAAEEMRQEAEQFKASLESEIDRLKTEGIIAAGELAKLTARRDETRDQISQLRERLVP